MQSPVQALAYGQGGQVLNLGEDGIPEYQARESALTGCALDLVLAVGVDAQHCTIRLKGHKAKTAVLRAVDLVARQIHIHHITEPGEVLLHAQSQSCHKQAPRSQRQ